MIKFISAAIRNPSAGRSLADFHGYWGERHGPLFARTPELRRYVQHHTLPEAYGGDPAPTHDGASMFWFDEVDGIRSGTSPRLADVIREADGDLYEWYVRSKRYGEPTEMTLRETVLADDRQLFDRETSWPTHHKRTSIAATEHVILDGPTRPEMVKLLFVMLRLPGLSLEEFSTHWRDVHGPLVSKLPGLRRYVQNHVVPASYGARDTTHDGFAELWFDDLESVRRAVASPEWQASREDGRTLIAQPSAVVVARERVIKG